MQPTITPDPLFLPFDYTIIQSKIHPYNKERTLCSLNKLFVELVDYTIRR